MLADTSFAGMARNMCTLPHVVSTCQTHVHFDFAYIKPFFGMRFMHAELNMHGSHDMHALHDQAMYNVCKPFGPNQF